MKVYIERTVSPPLAADQVRDKSRVGEVVYGAPFRVLDLLDNGLMTWAMAEQLGRVWFAEHGHRQFEAMVPKCPSCKEPLVCRDSSRRFMEDDRYAECENGHVWNLTAPAE